jgi:uncharacterized protein DUF3237
MSTRAPSRTSEDLASDVQLSRVPLSALDRLGEGSNVLGFVPAFSIRCRGREIECGLPVRVPGGKRLHVSYFGGQVRAAKQGPLPSFNGCVLSGTDWVLVRDDGVLVFDGRLTLGSDNDLSDIDFDGRAARASRRGDNLDTFLVSATLSGVVDLDSGRGRAQADSAPPPLWDALSGVFPVALPMRFEGSTTRVSWAKPRLRALAESFTRYSPLVQNPFIAVGDVTIQTGQLVQVDFVVGMLKVGEV